MTIVLQTSLLGPVDTDRATIIAAFTGGAYDAPTVATFADAVLARCAEFGFRASILCGQIAHETKFFRYGGQVKPEQNNYAGLGATNGGAAGASFRSADEGVCAVLTHHQAWMHGDVRNWPPQLQRYVSLDARYAAVLSTGRAGTVATIGGYTNGNWAYTATIPIGSLANGYAAGIASLANQFVGASPVSTVPTEADLGYPGHVHYATGSGESMDIADVRWFVIHDTEGHFAGDEATLSGQISAHLLIDKTGEWRFMVPLTSVAYATGDINVNRLSINVEHSGYADAHDGGYTDAQYRCCAAFYRFCVANGMAGVPAVYIGKQDSDGGPLPDAAGILGHQDVPTDDGSPGWGGDYHHTDPGPTYQWDKLIAYIGSAPQPPAPPVKQFKLPGADGTMKDVGEGIYNLVTATPEANSARTRTYGLAKDSQHDEYLVTGANDAQRAKGLSVVAHPVVVVNFERVPVLWDHARTPAPFDVRVPMQEEGLLLADDVELQAILTSMRLANEPI